MSMPGDKAALNQQETARMPGNVGIKPSGVGSNFRQRGQRDRLQAMRACRGAELIIRRCVHYNTVLEYNTIRDG